MANKNTIRIALILSLLTLFAVLSKHGPFGESALLVPVSSVVEGADSGLLPGPNGASRDAVSDREGTQLFGYHAPAGRSMLFDLRLDQTTELLQGGDAAAGGPSGGSQEIGVELIGGMRLDVLARDGKKVIVRVALIDASLQPSRQVDPLTSERFAETARQLGKPAEVLMQDDGSIHGISFDPDVDAEARQWLRTVLATFRFAVSTDGTTEWENQESDTTGEASVAYRFLDEDLERIGREKLSYLGTAEAPELATATLSGSAEGLLDRGLGWLRKATVEERMSVALGFNGTTVRSCVKAKLELVDSEDRPLAVSLVGFDDGVWASMRGLVDADLLAAALDLHQRTAELEGVTLDMVLEELRDALASGGLQSNEAFMAKQKLTSLLALRPELAATLAELLRTGALDGDVALFAVSALGSSQTMEAQSALAGLLGDANLGEELRTNAIRSAFQVAAPGPGLIAEIHSVIGVDAPQDVEISAMLLYGHLANGIMDPSGTATIDNLMQMEWQSAESGMPNVWLESLGNAGAVAIQALPRIEEYLESDNAGIRDAAISALRDVIDPKVTALLKHSATQDAAVSVRSAAGELLAARAGTDSVAASAAQELLKTEPSPNVRRSVLHGLTENEGGLSPYLKSIVAWSANNDQDPAVKIYAQQILIESNGG